MPLPPLPLLLTSVVGSYTVPSWLSVALEQIRQGAFGRFDIRETLDDAVTVAIDDQERAGVDVISDGEMRRQDFIMSFYDRLAGLRAGAPARKVVALFNRTVAGVRAKVAMHTASGTSTAVPAAGAATRRSCRTSETSRRANSSWSLPTGNWRRWTSGASTGGHKELAAGVIDIKSFHAESPQEVAERIRAALKVTTPERLWVVPDCGFAFVPRWLAFAKMKAIVEGAHRVRKELGIA